MGSLLWLLHKNRKYEKLTKIELKRKRCEHWKSKRGPRLCEGDARSLQIQIMSFINRSYPNCQTQFLRLLFFFIVAACFNSCSTAHGVVLHVLLQSCVAQTASIMQSPLTSSIQGLTWSWHHRNYPVGKSQNQKIQNHYAFPSLTNFPIPAGEVSQIQPCIHPFLSLSLCIYGDRYTGVCMDRYSIRV